jgi:hypothetical protein
VIYNIGFTGSRNGMTVEQRATFEIAINDILKDPDLVKTVTEFRFRHGDCVGADDEAHDSWRHIFRDWHSAPIVVHPPLDFKYRAFKNGDTILQNRDYLDRDRDIVEASQYLIGTPGSMKPKQRSGSWYTIRYAAKIHVEGSVILPDGMVIPVADYV